MSALPTEESATTGAASVTTALPEFVERNRPTLDRALRAIAEREYWTPYPESLKAYGEQGAAEGKAAFDAYLNRPFPLRQPGTDGVAAGERSPYGVDLGVTYPHANVDELSRAMTSGMPAWRDAGPLARAAVCVEALSRLNARSHEMAHAVMHTSGQGYAMAFQAGGPHAQDRGLEAVAYAYAAMTSQPARAEWAKPRGRREPARMAKTFTIVPRGIGLVVGCNTFPTWNSYPGLFASLATGNAVIVKPHPAAVLPLAITVSVLRDVLTEAGFDPNLVTLAVERPGEGLAKTLAVRPEIRLIDYTGSTEFGVWLERNAPQALVFTEKAGVNTVVIDSVDDYQGMLANLAFSLSLYSGQMCTTPQNLLIPRGGITAGGAHRSFAEVCDDLAAAVNGLLGDDARATALLGAIVNPAVAQRLTRASSLGRVVLPSRAITHPRFAAATVRTPLIIALDAAKPEDLAAARGEWFGPISFVLATDSTESSVALLRELVGQHGAITAAVYSTDEHVLDVTERAAWDAGVNLSQNLTSDVYVNQSAAFSDFHATGANPAANAALSDLAYVAGRFRVVQSRRPV